MKEPGNIEFGALRVFAAVADSETLTQAAQRLGISQSAVSQAIKQLEAQAGVELVVRRARPTQLTPSGQVLQEHAVKILADSRRMLNEVRGATSGAIAQLTVGMIDSFGDLAGLQFMQRTQSLVEKLSLRTGVGTSLSEALLYRELDLLITSDPMEDHPELEQHPILRDPFVIILPADQQLEMSIEPAWLAQNLPFIHYTKSSRIGALTDLFARRLDLILKVRYELDSTQTLLRFVQSGQGWAMIPALCLARYPELLKGVSIKPLGNGGNARYLSLLSHNGELGELPANMTTLCRQICDEELIPPLVRLAPWLESQLHTITELPPI
ncbi:MAG: DNA-binding transcriptional LysR family regulator [Halieaceae bacterium]|jgi:DNA-binding transcriptional LysR family regulator